MNARSNNVAGLRAHRRVWLLAALGIVAGLLILVLVYSTLAQFQMLRKDLGEVQDNVATVSKELTRVVADAHAEEEHLLAAVGTGFHAEPWEGALAESLARARAISRHTGVTAVLDDLENAASAFRSRIDEARDWSRRHVEIRARLRLTSREVEDRLRDLSAAITSEEGRQKLKTARKIRGFRSLGVTNANASAGELIEMLQSGAGLTEANVEISELARHCERLSHEVSLDEMANLKDNLIAASLVRLSRDLSTVASSKATAEATGSVQSGLLAVQQALFGTNGAAGPGAIPAGGLYRHRHDYLVLERQKEEIRSRIDDAERQFRAELSGLDIELAGMVSGMGAETEGRLRRVWWNTAILGLVASTLFILLAANVAGTIRKQMCDLESGAAVLARQSERLKESEERFALAAKGTADGIWDWNIETNSAYFSPRFEELIGAGTDELPATFDSFLELVHPGHLSAFNEALQDHVKRRRPFDVEARLCTRGGFQRWFRIRGHAAWGPDNQPMRIAGSITDVTERVLAEQRLRESEERFRSMADSAPVLIWVTDADKVCTYFNRAWLKMLGCSLSNAIRQGLFSPLHPDDASPVRQIVDEAFENQVPFKHESRIRRRDGEDRWLMTSAVPRFNEDGSFAGYIGGATDITEQKRIQLQIEQARVSLAVERAQLAAFVEHAPAAVAMFDRRMRYLAVSRRWLVEYSLEGQEIIGRGHYEVFPNIPERWKEIHRRCLAGAIERCDDDVWRPPDWSRDQHLRWEIRPWMDAEQQIAGIMMFTQDITADRLREAELGRMRDAADAASRAKSEFLATMSHEIRTPMNGVLGFTNLLLDTTLTDEQRQFLLTIRSSGESLLTIINDILDFSKIEAGKLTVESIPYNLAELTEQVAELLSSQAEDKNLQLALDYAVDAPRQMLGDPGRVRQVILNLTGNAIKFTSRGHVIIRVGPMPGDPGVVKIGIVDTGIGIPPEKQSALFNKFTQADSSTTRRYGGTGLGLAISKQLAELMGGQIGVVSGGNEGSTFWFTLPVPVGLPQKPRPSLPADVLEGRVLVFQQDAVNLEVLQAQLRALNVRHSCTDSLGDIAPMLKNASRAGNAFKVLILDDVDANLFDLFGDPELQNEIGVVIATAGHKWSEVQRRMKGASVTCLVKPLVRTAHLISALTAACRMPVKLPATGAVHALDDVRKPAAGPTSSRPSPAETRAPRTLKYRVLVVEDNSTNQLLARRFLQDLDCCVDLATNGREAVERTGQQQYDLVLMDCHMPILDGFEATQSIRAREKEKAAIALPIVALTASAFEQDRQHARESGMDDFITKPLSKAELRRVLSTWVDRDRQVSI